MIGTVELRVLQELRLGAKWTRSFQPVKPVLKRLIDSGHTERCRPPLGRGNNMVRLTEAGERELFAESLSKHGNIVSAAASVLRSPEWGGGAVRRDLCVARGASQVRDDRTRRTCDSYARAIAAGEHPSDIVAALSATEGVQRPAIWRRLRAGGLIPPYGHRQQGGPGRPIGGGAPGYSSSRREAGLSHAARNRPEPRPEQYVNRDPCPRCGVRRDYGCSHSQAPLGMSF